MGMLFKTTGEVEPIEPKNGTHFELEELQNYVGGLIERVGLHRALYDHPTCLILNEEGKLTGLSYNQRATSEWVKTYGLTDRIVGDVVLVEEFSAVDPEDGMLWR